ncbi:DNA translocase FtsK [Bhargavaea ginsengi]|uniref:DNA translocase FtsK n=1 Tax=Bhargavaea ginsengi TaxID=426757 RepID=UPI002041295B|nr:DNA translocase FtsK [Bhargavaea ginsengi]MCM3087442.1 DNA translocase FtsK [Bhargavaea ginsengi]
MATKRNKKKKRRTSAKKKKSGLYPLGYELSGLVMTGLAIITFFSLGFVGRGLGSASRFLFGNWHAALPFLFLIFALLLMVKREIPDLRNRIVGGLLLILGSLTLFSHVLLFTERYESGRMQTTSALKETWIILVTDGGITDPAVSLGGGIVGGFLFAMFHVLFDSAGATIAGIIMLSMGLILLTGKALVPYLAEKLPEAAESIREWFTRERKPARPKPQKREKPEKQRRSRRSAENEEAATRGIDGMEAGHQQEVYGASDPEPEPVRVQPIISSFTERAKPSPKEENLSTGGHGEEETQAEGDTVIHDIGDVQPVNEDFVLPPVSLLNPPPENDQSGEYNMIQHNAEKLEKTFHSFGVKASVTEVHLGPAVTKYEVMPATGVKVSRIVSLADDIALALAARDIRIEAPIPGKSAVGIEVPNTEVAMVSLREVLEARNNNRPDSKLMVALGRDISGEAVMAELNKMPHMLVAGATGSGKSVCINGIIISILMRAKPHEVKMMMIDPKMVELNVYNGVPHLLAPVVTDPRKASQALKKVVAEMERRYDLFSHTGTRNIEGYNLHIDEWNEENEEKHPRLPYIVVIVDELADLMMVASSDVEDSITRIAQMARAAGIHLIIATQRPSVDVITGIIKANIPSRIAFAVSSAVDSRTILDSGGAEKLLGRGDMLYLPAGASKPTRIQGAFLSDQEVEEVVDFVISQQKAQYEESMIPTEVEEVAPHEETDELYDEAVDLVRSMQQASVSMLQRRFRIGYSRAARIVDQMEMRGVVGPHEGSKPRQVLVQDHPDES